MFFSNGWLASNNEVYQLDTSGAKYFFFPNYLIIFVYLRRWSEPVWRCLAKQIKQTAWKNAIHIFNSPNVTYLFDIAGT